MSNSITFYYHLVDGLAQSDPIKRHQQYNKERERNRQTHKQALKHADKQILIRQVNEKENFPNKLFFHSQTRKSLAHFIYLQEHLFFSEQKTDMLSKTCYKIFHFISQT